MPYKQTVTGSNPVSPTINYMPRFCVAFLFWAFSSAGEHFLHTEGVIGSIPVTPTIEIVAEVICLGFFYCTAIVDEDQDAVVTYYTFCSESQAAADDAANDENAADDDANATVDDAEESNIASSQTGGAMDDARDGRRWQHRGHLGCRRFASVAHLIISCAVFSLNVLIVKRTGLIPVRYPNLSS